MGVYNTPNAVPNFLAGALADPGARGGDAPPGDGAAEDADDVPIAELADNSDDQEVKIPEAPRAEDDDDPHVRFR